MVLRNIVKQCIIQIRQGLWPRTVLRKVTEPVPFPAHWAQIFSIWLESQRRNWTFYPKYYCKMVASRPFLRERTWASMCKVGGGGCPHTAPCESVTGGCQARALRRWTRFASHISNQQWDAIREISVWKQHRRATGVGTQNCTEDSRTSPTWSLGTGTWDSLKRSTCPPEPPALIKKPPPGASTPFPAPSFSPLRVNTSQILFAPPRLPEPHALSGFK